MTVLCQSHNPDPDHDPNPNANAEFYRNRNPNPDPNSNPGHNPDLTRVQHILTFDVYFSIKLTVARIISLKVVLLNAKSLKDASKACMAVGGHISHRGDQTNDLLFKGQKCLFHIFNICIEQH